jgi:hypothetical protein
VELGDDATYPIERMGFISFHVPSSDLLELNGVLYVLGLIKNLLSNSIMVELGCIVEFKNQQVIIQRKCPNLGGVLAKGIQEGGLYMFLVNPVRALKHENDNLCKLWHKRLGHLHYKALSILKYMVQGLTNFMIEKIEVCKGYALNKNAKIVFPSNEHRSTKILDLICLDM